MDGRKQSFRTVGEGEGVRRKAKRLVEQLNRMEQVPKDGEDRFLSWHRSGEPLPLDRAVRDHARAAKQTVAVSTATRYRQFAERLVERLGRVDLRRLQKEDIGRFVRAEHADGRGKDPTINACVLLRGAVLAALRTRDEAGRPHMAVALSRPSPPYASGTSIANKPMSPARLSSVGTTPGFFSPISAMRGITSLSMNSSAVRAIARCCSVKSSGVKTSSGMGSIRKAEPTGTLTANPPREDGAADAEGVASSPVHILATELVDRGSS